MTHLLLLRNLSPQFPSLAPPTPTPPPRRPIPRFKPVISLKPFQSPLAKHWLSAVCLALWGTALTVGVGVKGGPQTFSRQSHIR